jgi:hypothetical protein
MLATILGVYALLAISYSVIIPLWEAPDEPSHYRYAQYLADNHSLPPPQPPQAGRFFQNNYATSLYEWYQPPLYYVLLGPSLAWLHAVQPQPSDEVFPAVNPQFPSGAIRLFSSSTAAWSALTFASGPRLARSFSILLGLLTLFATYAIARTLSPSDPLLALVATGFMGFIPQYTFLTGYITNDNLADLIASLTVLLVVQFPVLARPRWERYLLMTSALVALGIFTKFSLLFLVPLAVVGIVMSTRLESGRSAWAAIRKVTTLAVFSLFLPITALLFVPGIREQWIYSRVALQPRESLTSWDNIVNLWPLTISSFWGRFGWMDVALPEMVTNLLTGMALFSLLSAAFGWLRLHKIDAIRWEQQTVLWMNVLFVVAGFLAFNFSIFQPQGRLLYPALSSLAILMSFGLLRLAGPYRVPVGAALVLTMLVVNLFALVAVLWPAYYEVGP